MDVASATAAARGQGRPSAEISGLGLPSARAEGFRAGRPIAPQLKPSAAVTDPLERPSQSDNSAHDEYDNPESRPGIAKGNSPDVHAEYAWNDRERQGEHRHHGQNEQRLVRVFVRHRHQFFLQQANALNEGRGIGYGR